MVTVAAVALLIGMPVEPAWAAKTSRAAPWDDLFKHLQPRARGKARHVVVPLPKPRPAEATSAEPEEPAQKGQASPENDKAKQQAAPAPQPTPQPSACRLALTDEVAIAPSIPDIKGAGGCGGEDLVRLEAIVLPDKRRVSVKPAARSRARRFSWVFREPMVPIYGTGERSAISVAGSSNLGSCDRRTT